MQDAVPYADILILALIAGFILLRLRNVLGQRGSGEEADFLKRLKQQEEAVEAREPIVQLSDRTHKHKPKDEPDTYLDMLSDKALVASLESIKAKDPQFTATRFLEGARTAFEMVFDAFAKGDKQTLAMLLSDPLFKEFSAEIEERAKEENRTETTLVSFVSRDIEAAAMNGPIATITVKFVSEQITVVRNPKGEIIEGDPSQLNHVEDEWVFERDITSKNPNWKIIET